MRRLLRANIGTLRYVLGRRNPIKIQGDTLVIRRPPGAFVAEDLIVDSLLSVCPDLPRRIFRFEYSDQNKRAAPAG